MGASPPLSRVGRGLRYAWLRPSPARSVLSSVCKVPGPCRLFRPIGVIPSVTISSSRERTGHVPQAAWSGPPGPDQPRAARAARAVRLAAGAAGVAALAVYLYVALSRLGYPFALEWLEGNSLVEVRRILAGQQLYTAPGVGYVPDGYPPLFFAVG